MRKEMKFLVCINCMRGWMQKVQPWPHRRYQFIDSSSARKQAVPPNFDCIEFLNKFLH